MKSLETLYETKILRTIEALEKNNIKGIYLKDEKKIFSLLKSLLKEKATIGFGGSKSLEQLGVLDFLRKENYNLLDRAKPGLSQEEIKKILKECFFADYYLASANAITENGEIYNVDGTGNRVAAITYGPEKVILFVGANKIVANVEEAIERNKNIAAPANCLRLNKNTPCSKLGHCVECNSQDRICSTYVLMKYQKIKDRITVVFLNKSLGY